MVVVGNVIGAGASQEYSVTGATPNLAARLQTLAEPSCIVVAANISAVPWVAASAFINLGSFELKGFSAC